jgi:hypothetical protein
VVKDSHKDFYSVDAEPSMDELVQCLELAMNGPIQQGNEENVDEENV